MSTACEITIVLDRSASMRKIREATVQGINSFISEVRATPGQGFWTVVQFDDPVTARGAGEPFPLILFDRVPDAQMPVMTLEDFKPRGNTFLIEALCLTIDREEARWLAIPEAERPRKMLLIVTDGEDNSQQTACTISRFTSDDLRERMGRIQGKHDWKVDYIGANQDSFAEVRKYGILEREEKTAGGVLLRNVANFTADAAGVQQVFSCHSDGARHWKADGNESAVQMLSSAAPEKAGMP